MRKGKRRYVRERENSKFLDKELATKNSSFLKPVLK
jgi:hypothetical protein